MLRDMEFAIQTRPAREIDGSNTASRTADRGRSIATDGLTDSAQTLPFLEQIQGSFGPHDVRDVEAHAGSSSARANAALGADAYTLSERIAFGEPPSLRTAAHEAA